MIRHVNKPSVDYLLDDVAASKFIGGSDGHCDRLRLLQVGVEMKMTLLVVLRQLLSADDRANDGAECVLGALEEVIQLGFCKGKSGIVVLVVEGNMRGDDMVSISPKP